MTGNSIRNSETYIQLEKEIKTSLKKLLIVPKRLKDPEPEIKKAKLSMSKKRYSYQWNGYVHTDEDEPNINTTSKLADRALRIMDTLLKCLKARGYKIHYGYRYTRVEIKKVSMTIGLREPRKKLPLKEKSSDQEYIPSGILVFTLDNYRGTEWKDGKEKLEDQILPILTRMEFEVNELHKIWEANAQRKKKEDEQNYLRELRQNYVKAELNEFKDLLLTAKRWKEAQILREYLYTLEETSNLTPEFKHWLTCAKEKLNWYDPATTDQYSLFKDIDPNKI